MLHHTWRAPALSFAALAAAPLFGLVSELVVPRDTTNTPADELRFVSAHAGAFLLADLLAIVGAALFVVGLVRLVPAVSGRGRVAVRIGGTMAIAGSLALVAHPFLLLAIRDLATAENLTAMAQANDAISNGVAAMVILVARLLAFDLGLVVLTIGLWRAGALPVWLAPAGFLALFADFSPSSYNAVLMYAVLAATFVLMALRARRTADPVSQPTGEPAAAGTV
ncbi:hypothetical protein ACFWVC_37205 [Streptomyces sp. NPDC058691]|uniref:hypothetical protein n=1 Tax=Streptomyces sp. NPDC058691 TaxID=3346601 RepID=UPI00365995A7